MNGVEYYVTLNGKRYTINPPYKRIKLRIAKPKGRHGYLPPIERTIDWDGPTGLAVRKALAQQEIK